MPCCRGREQHCRADDDDLGTETMAESCSSFPTEIKYSFKHLALFFWVFFTISKYRRLCTRTNFKGVFHEIPDVFIRRVWSKKTTKLDTVTVEWRIPGGHPTDSSLISQASSTATFQGILGSKASVCCLFQPSVHGHYQCQTGSPGKPPKGKAFLRRIF